MAPTPPPTKKRKISPPVKRGLIGFQPGHAIVSGGTGRGKTFFVVDAILGEGVHKGLGDPPWDAVHVLCDGISMHQPAYKRLKQKFTGKGGVSFHEGVPVSDEEGAGEGIMSEKAFLDKLSKNFNNGLSTLVIVDDLMCSTKSGPAEKFIDKLFISARHLKTSVWEINQCHTANRTRRLQSAYLVCFGMPSDTRALAHICAGIMPEDKGHKLLKMYRQSTESKNGHGCLIMAMNENPLYMFRNSDMRVCFDMSKF
jgi:hypothetical protein